MIRPKRNGFLQDAKLGTIVPVVKELDSDLITPADAFYASDAAYLLESAEKGTQVGRYSFLGIESEATIHINENRVEVNDWDGKRNLVHNDPLRIVGEVLKSYRYIESGDLSPFPGGAVGYVGYDMIRMWEKLPISGQKPGLDVPDGLFMITKYNLVFDHLMHSLKIIYNVRVSEDLESDYDQAEKGLLAIEERLTKRLNVDLKKSKGKEIANPVFKSSFSHESYCAAVSEIKEMIASGEAIQVVLSQRLRTSFEGDPFTIYRALRSINPSPYMFYLNFGDFSIFGTSPEVMVRNDQGKALLRPIAGTRPRGRDIAEDERLKIELLNDEKEKAEHLMLVDLARNDLGRIAKPGSVSLDRFMDIESYSHVMHIVSEVTAELKSDADTFDLIKATFPAGTVSGAPKVRAMQIIDQFESVKRGPYAGMIGYMSYRGDFDSCITIRSMVAKDGELYLQAGAGIVYDSDPEKEYQETLNKARALFAGIKKGIS